VLGTSQPNRPPIGTPADFANQNAPEKPTTDFPFRLGIPEACWLRPDDLTIDPVEIFSIGSCCLTLAYARLIDLVYEEEIAKITDFISCWMGFAPVVHFYPISGLLPAFALIMHPTFTLAVIAGTDNEEQLATQTFQGAIPPTTVAGFGTLPLWLNTANYILGEMFANGSTGLEPVMLTGHSYGAAVASVMAMRMIRANQGRDVSLLTFASPKPANQRGIDLLNFTKHRHIANYGDLVTVIPTNIQESGMYGAFITLAIQRIWGSWESFPVSEIYLADGTYFLAASQNLAYNVLLPAMVRFFLGQDWSPSAHHNIKEYIRRLAIFCDGPCWPIKAPCWAIIFGPGEPGDANVLLGGATNDVQNFIAGTAGVTSTSAEPTAIAGAVAARISAQAGADPAAQTYRTGVFLG